MVLIERAVDTPDGEGGFVQTWATVYAAAAGDMRTHSKQDYSRIEAARGGSGPGLATVVDRFCLFMAKEWPNGWPDVRVNDRITDIEGIPYVVHHVHSYALTMQVDCEAVA